MEAITRFGLINAAQMKAVAQVKSGANWHKK